MNYFILTLLWLGLSVFSLSAQGADKSMDISPLRELGEIKEMNEQLDSLVILWTLGDPNVALKMVFMYAKASIKMNGGNQLILLYGNPLLN